MPSKKLNWSVYSKEPRLSVVDKLKEAISSNGGSITHFHMFSDLALSLRIEIECNQIANLHRSLSRVVSVSELESGVVYPDSKQEWVLLLNVSFSDGKGELRKNIPAVPG